jgi:hypothetical protein
MGSNRAPIPEFIVKTTGELTIAEKEAMSGLFSEVFRKPFPLELFESKYARSCLGKSFHCLMVMEGVVVGAYSAIPVRYLFFGHTRLFAMAVDLMIAERFRGRLIHLKSLSETLLVRLAAEGVAFFFGCAREEMWTVHEAVSKWEVAGRVSYYVAPFCVRYFGRAAILLGGAVRAWNLHARQPGRAVPPAIEKINDADFAAYRYRMYPVRYKRVELDSGGACVYTTELFYPIEGLPKDLRLGVLLDVDPLSKEKIEQAVDAIRARESNLEFLAYQGYLPFQPRNLLRIPERLERPPWFLAGRILLPDLVDKRVFEIANWNINLSNGDLI